MFLKNTVQRVVKAIWRQVKKSTLRILGNIGPIQEDSTIWKNFYKKELNFLTHDMNKLVNERTPFQKVAGENSALWKKKALIQ
jgi:hypothetical protein